MVLGLIVSNGVAGKWAFGVIIISHLIVYNEVGGLGACLALPIAALFSICSVLTRNGVKNVQIAYLRAAHRFDFFCLFLASWMDILALLAACSALARTLSTCLDSMTGGLARIYILGRNSPQNEPWPDVLGVGVIFVLSSMFMLGLENTYIFTLLMASGVLGITCILSGITWDQGSRSLWKEQKTVLSNMKQVLSASALYTFIFPNTTGNTTFRYPVSACFIAIGTILVSNLITTGMLSELVQLMPNREYEAVPMLSILEEKTFHKVLPAVACLLVIACSGALLDLYPEMIDLIVKLTKSDYKILPRQIGYENRESGSPVLAVFTGGSFCAMLAFACPLEDMTFIIAGANLFAIILRSFYLLYQPFRPKFTTQQNGTTLSYSRLNINNSTNEPNTHKLLGLFNKAASQTYNAIPKSLSRISKLNKEVEREWLLLGEPPLSPKTVTVDNTASAQDVESTILSDPSTSDIECIAKAEPQHSDSESTTDIDAIVAEYEQTLKVTAIGTAETTVRIPTQISWWIAITIIIFIFLATLGSMIRVRSASTEIFISCAVIAMVAAIGLLILPSYQCSSSHPSPVICTITIFSAGTMCGTIVHNCWGPVLFWTTAAILLYIRCDRLMCVCLDSRYHHNQRPSSMREPLVPGCGQKVHVPILPHGEFLQDRIMAHR